MSLHLLQHRSLVRESGDPPSFPAQVKAEISLAPEDMFGAEGAAPRTTVPVGEQIALRWDTNAAVVEVKRGSLIESLDASLELGKVDLNLVGNRLEICFEASSGEEAEAALASANYCVPAYLSLHSGLYVWIKNYQVDIGDSQFTYNIKRGTNVIVAADKDMMEGKVASALEDWHELGGRYDRVLAACLYLRHAQRLIRIQPHNLSFIAEVLLNLTKALEIIFSDNRDRIREKAQDWGFEKQYVKKKIIPLFLIRNEIDVAHVSTGMLTAEEREILISFMREAVVNTREVIKQIVALVKANEIELEGTRRQIRKDKRRLLSDVAKYLDQEQTAT